MRKLLSFLFGSRPQAIAEIREDPRAVFHENLKTASLSQLSDWSRHYDGFIREAVLVRAAELRSPELLDAILDRLNDWVPQVRQAARIALLMLVPLLPPSAILKTLPVMDRLRLAKRENHADWIEQFHVTVIDALGADVLIAEAVLAKGDVARSCFDIVDAHSLLGPYSLTQRVLNNGADFGTSIAAWRLATKLEANERSALAEIGLKSGFGAVRTAALRELLTSASKQADDLAEQALFDTQSSVRAVAMWYLKQKGCPVAKFYVDRLSEAGLAMRVMRICLASLAVCGTHEHATIIQRFINISHARTQATAVVSWARLAPDARDEILRFALLSPFPRVRKLAIVLMDDFGAYIDLGEAIALAENKSDHTLALAFARREPWTWITTILTQARNSVELPRKDHLNHELRSWLAASANIYSRPTDAQVRDLSSPATRRVINEIFGHDVFCAKSAFQDIFRMHGLIR